MLSYICFENKIGENDSVHLHDTAVGSIEFLLIWISEFPLYVPLEDIIELRSFAAACLALLVEKQHTASSSSSDVRHAVLILLVDKTRVLLEQSTDAAKAAQLRGSYAPRLPVNRSIQLRRETAAEKAAAEKAAAETLGTLTGVSTKTSNINSMQSQKFEVFGVSLDMDEDDFSQSSVDTTPSATDEALSDVAAVQHKPQSLRHFLSVLPVGFQFLSNSKLVYHALFSLDVGEVARQWTVVDQNLFASIGLSEFSNKSWSDPRYLARGVGIRRFIDRFNAMSGWVTTSVLMANTNTSAKIEIALGAKKGIPLEVLQSFDESNRNDEEAGSAVDRALLFCWMIDLAICFDKLNNFNGMDMTSMICYSCSYVLTSTHRSPYRFSLPLQELWR